jgi:uncharacterized protein YegP (UPF0339 family)
MKLKIFKGKNNQYYFHIVSRNGKIVAQSEGYKSRQSVLKTAKLFNLEIVWL